MGPVAAIVMIVGGVISAIGAISESQAKAKQLESNAQIAETQAQEAQFLSQENARRKRLQLNRLIGKQRAGFAKGGVRTTEGTALLVQEETEQEGQFDIDLSLRAGNIESLILKRQAADFRSRASSEKTAGFLGAAGSLLGSVGGSGILKGGGGGAPFKFSKGFNATIQKPLGFT